MSTAAANAAHAFKEGDGRAVGRAMASAAILLVPGADEVIISRYTKYLGDLDRRITAKEKGDKVTFLRRQRRNLNRMIERAKKPKGAVQKPLGFDQVDPWTREASYTAPRPSQSVEDVRQIIRDDAAMRWPFEDSMTEAQRLEVYKKRTQLYDTVERLAEAEQRRLRGQLKSANRADRMELETQLEAASKLESAAKKKPLAGRLSQRKSDQLTKDALEYVRDIQMRTGVKLHPKQIKRLGQALREKLYKKLPTPAAVKKHRKAFRNVKDDLIAEWEANTGQTWPRYREDVITKDGGRRAGDAYDAHHIIENKYGGEHAWWNIHPARYPEVHQGGIHGKGAPAGRLFE